MLSFPFLWLHTDFDKTHPQPGVDRAAEQKKLRSLNQDMEGGHCPEHLPARGYYVKTVKLIVLEASCFGVYYLELDCLTDAESNRRQRHEAGLVV